MRDAKLSTLFLLSVSSLLSVFIACSDQDARAGGEPRMAADRDLSPEDLVTRGRYLVDHVSGCTDCHSPRDQMGAPIAAQYLAGAECFVRLDNGSCLSTSNLTNHETGLLKRSDAEIKRTIADGVRPSASGEEALFPGALPLPADVSQAMCSPLKRSAPSIPPGPCPG